MHVLFIETHRVLNKWLLLCEELIPLEGWEARETELYRSHWEEQLVLALTVFSYEVC